MSDASAKPSRTVSFRKSGTAGPTADPTADTGVRPTQVLVAIGALVLAGLSVVAAAISLFFLRGWLISATNTAQDKLKKSRRLSPQQVLDQVHKVPTSQMIASTVLMLALLLVAFAIWRGRYWARWAVIGLWVLSSFTGTIAGLNSAFAITASIPIAFKLPAAISAAAFIAAVVCVLLPSSKRYFARTKPARAGTPGAPARRGLFAPRVPPAAGGARAGAPTRPARPVRASAGAGDTSADAVPADRSRSKKRSGASDAQAVAKGAELARSRAKAASKSRRTEV